VERNLHNFPFPNPFSEYEELQQQQCLPQFESILDSHHSCHLPPAPFRVEIENTTLKRLIGSDLHFHKLFAPILMFLSQTGFETKIYGNSLFFPAIHDI
jgi:hypothetical protein